jgi:hypothetical protein
VGGRSLSCHSGGCELDVQCPVLSVLFGVGRPELQRTERRRSKYRGGCIKDDGKDQRWWNARLRSRAAVAFFISWLQGIVLEVAVDTLRVSLLVRRT